ncbi:hypothetical protein GS883_21825 [Rhodococcus hoagii]|nr:hypothetical protein [Prescottella equi]
MPIRKRRRGGRSIEARVVGSQSASDTRAGAVSKRQMPHGGAGSCSGSTDDRGELPRQQLRVRAGETRDVVQQSARQTTRFVVATA